MVEVGDRVRHGVRRMIRTPAVTSAAPAITVERT